MVGLFRPLVAAVAVVSLLGGATASACPKGTTCPSMDEGRGTASPSSHAGRSCCQGEPKSPPVPESRGCPGDCCRPTSDLPATSDAVPAPQAAPLEGVFAESIALAPPVSVAVILDTGPLGGQAVPAWLRSSALLI